jgi:beta-glucosidase/6-phospho-beta-glucosidase/beta-galactosidase
MTHAAEGPLVWAVGIEDTNVGWPLAGSPDGLDEYAVTQHYAHWREDLALAVSVGATAVRYGFPWYRVETAPGVFDWEFTDEVVAEAERLGIDLIVDLVHYGTPTWLPGSFTDPGYPAAVTRWAGAVAARYRGRFSSITPLNEPLVTASFVGARGIWPPHERGETGWCRVVVSIAEGIQASIHEIRRVAPEMAIVHVEATHVWTAETAELDGERQLLDQKNWLPTDLVLGRVTEGHPLRSHLTANGIDPRRLERLATGAARPDTIGVNYYPELSARQLALVDGAVVGITFNAWRDGLEQIVRGFVDRYGLPVLISETAVEGHDAHRIRWLDAVVALVHELRADGVPVAGLVWWPLFDFVDWSWATGDQVIEEFYSRVDGVITPIYPPTRGAGLDAYFRRMGLCRLETDGDEVRRVRTPVADAFLRHTLVSPSPAIDASGRSA